MYQTLLGQLKVIAPRGNAIKTTKRTQSSCSTVVIVPESVRTVFCKAERIFTVIVGHFWF